MDQNDGQGLDGRREGELEELPPQGVNLQDALLQEIHDFFVQADQLLGPPAPPLAPAQVNQQQNDEIVLGQGDFNGDLEFLLDIQNPPPLQPPTPNLLPNGQPGPAHAFPHVALQVNYPLPVGTIINVYHPSYANAFAAMPEGMHALPFYYPNMGTPGPPPPSPVDDDSNSDSNDENVRVGQEVPQNDE